MLVSKSNAAVASTIPNQQNVAIPLARIDVTDADSPYQWPEHAIYRTTRPTRLNTWHARLGHILMEKEAPTIDHLRVPGSTVYVLIHEADRKGEKSNAAKFAPRTQCCELLGYDGRTLYHAAAKV